SNANNRGASVTVQGDLLRAARTGTTFALESSGVAGGRAGYGSTNCGTASCYGAIGPGGGYFYDPHPGLRDMTAPSPLPGGRLQTAGFGDVRATSTDVMDPLENGLLWFNNPNGRKTRRVQNVLSDASLASPGEGGFTKANGLGDLDAYEGRA